MQTEEFKTILLRKNSLRKNITDGALSLSDIDKVIADLGDIRSEVELAGIERKQAQEKRQQAIEELQKKMQELGIKPEDIASNASATGITRAPVKPKYRIIDADGKPHEWSGRGRTPRVFQERFDRGASKEDFLIQEA
jgi:DNA-binding protein H-NS